MPSVLAFAGNTETQSSSIAEHASKFRTVLGLSSLNSSSPSQLKSGNSIKYLTQKQRRSTDAARPSTSSHRRSKSRSDRASVTEVSFYEPDNDQAQNLTRHSSSTMKSQGIPQERASRRKLHMEAQDGPWSISVAESPYDKKSYSIYIKTPTHHLTLTRTVPEIVELHRKLSSSNSDISLPTFPLPEENLEQGNGFGEKKRKSSFLHTLSRLASPGPHRRERPKEREKEKVGNLAPSLRGSEVDISTTALPTPTPSPSKELVDPFVSGLSHGTSGTNSANATAIAAYLTTISNEPTAKHSKPWRRFVRVRTDDLESERVERAVKRVRSDLASHMNRSASGGTSVASISMVLDAPKLDVHFDEPTDIAMAVDLAADEVGTPVRTPKELYRGDLKDVEEEPIAEAEANPIPDAPTHLSEQVMDGLPPPPGRPEDLTLSPLEETIVSEVDRAAQIPVPPSPITPVYAHPSNPMPRSQSADPDKATMMSRIYRPEAEESAAESESEAPGFMDGETEAEGATTAIEDEESVTVPKRKKTRSTPDARTKEKRTRAERKVVIDDFDMMRVLGKGCAGKVLLVKHKRSDGLYALKAITKRHVLAHQELQHTLTEQSVLKRMAREAKDPFVVKLWWSFHDKENLFLVMDFHPGGDLATQLARWGRLGRDRARFYAAEIVEGVEGLHAAGVIYRDLKPENILIGADGHIVLTDFGLSKEFPRRSTIITAPPTPSGSRDFYSASPTTPEASLPYWMNGNGDAWPNQLAQNDSTSTFCGTAEYLAPEVIQGLPYSYEVDWWSFGTMLYEMLTGITPFWANNHSDMYVRVLQDELKFPDDRAMDQDTKSLLRGLLQRNPALRIKQPRIKRHPYFSMIDWSHVYFKRYIPPYIPPIDPSNASDTQNFDDAFLDMEPIIDNEPEQTDSDKGDPTDTDKTDGEESVQTPAQSRSPSRPSPELEDDVDLFDGYSFKGRQSIIIEEDASIGGVDDGYEGPDEDEELADEVKSATVHDVNSPLAPPVVDVAESEPQTPEPRQPPLPLSTDVTPVAETTDEETPISGTDTAPTPVEPLSETEPEPEQSQPSKVDDDSLFLQRPKTPPSRPVLGSVEVTPRRDPFIPEVEDLPLPKADTPTQATVKSHLTHTHHVQETSESSNLTVPGRSTKGRRGKSGIPALDKYLSDAGDDDTEKEDEDDDWDLVEAPIGEERNGPKGNSLFARGVVDRYKLAVFRKSSTPKRNVARNFSATSYESQALASDMSTTPTPSPSEKHRRGRNPALTFRRNPKQFLRTPPSTNSPSSTISRKKTQKSVTISSTNGSSITTGLLTPSPSTGPGTMTSGTSLKSKESATSVGSPGSSDQSVNGEMGVLSQPADLGGSIGYRSNGAMYPESSKRQPDNANVDEPEKPKPKKLNKYKEGAEKVLSLFASPRQ